MKKKKGKFTTQTTIVIMILIVIVVGYYCYLVNRSNRSTDERTPTTVEDVLLRDLENYYPSSPTQVIRYYNSIIKCFYNEECSREQLEELARKARDLYDQELLDNNEWDTYIFNLEKEIQDFKNNNRKISNISLASSIDVDEFTQDGYRFAKVRCAYNILQGRDSSSTIQVYLLRRDENRHWKIYGWDLAENLAENQDDGSGED